MSEQRGVGTVIPKLKSLVIASVVGMACLMVSGQAQAQYYRPHRNPGPFPQRSGGWYGTPYPFPAPWGGLYGGWGGWYGGYWYPSGGFVYQRGYNGYHGGGFGGHHGSYGGHGGHG